MRIPKILRQSTFIGYSFQLGLTPLSSLGPTGHQTLSSHRQTQELTPGISLGEYVHRRQRLLASLPDQSICIIPGYGLRYMTSNIFYPFHQNTNLLYLSGFNEPDAALILEKNGQSSRSCMFLRPRNPHLEMWDGTRTGLEGAKEVFSMDDSKPIESLPSFLSSLKSSNSVIITDLSLSCHEREFTGLDSTQINTSGSHATHQPSEQFNLPKQVQRFHDSSLASYFSWNSRSPKIEKVAPYIHKMRLIKSDTEVAVMRQSGRNSGRSFAKAMSMTKPGLSERQLHAILNYEVMMRGSSGLAYVPVVAGGKNALTLHYVRNDEILRDGDLVLVDAGGEYGHYASDITRTWPVNGKFSKAQRRVYEAVLRTQKALIKKCREESNVSLNDLQDEACRLLKNECISFLGRNVSDKEMDILYPHHVGHYIGLDLHDTPSMSKGLKLEKGMIVTIEPGLYIPNSHDYPAEFRGIGIRIEDDVAVGNAATGGPVVLTAEAPKEIEDIESVMANAHSCRTFS